MRRPLGTDGAPRKLAGGEGCSGYLYYAGLKWSTSPFTAPWPSLEGDNRYPYINGYSCRPVKLGVLNSVYRQIIYVNGYSSLTFIN